MSTDKSLKSKNTLQRHRNVLTRDERIAHLKDVTQWNDERSPFNLPKVAHRKAAVGKKDKAEKKPEEAAAGAAAAPAEGAAPAKGAAAAKGAAPAKPAGGKAEKPAKGEKPAK